MKLKSAIPIGAFILVLVFGLVDSRGTPPTGSRADFAVLLGKIKPNMPEEDVLALLGKPDDVRTELDPGGISRVDTREIWCYGSKGHLSFPTLGCVYIDISGRTQEVFGGRGRPPKSGLFKEAELRDLLRLLDTTPGLMGDSYNPLPIIKIVNTLQPLGKEKALAAIGEYIRVSDQWTGLMGPRYGLFMVLQVLFDLPKDVDVRRIEGFGAPSPSEPKNLRQIPRFPIALVDDIPMMLVSGYILEGIPIPMEEVVDFFRVNGQLRSRPLSPGNDPLAALTNLMASPQWILADTKYPESGGTPVGNAYENKREKAMLREQLLRMIDSVYRLPTDVFGDRLPWRSPDPAWKKIVADVSALKIKWDPQRDMYVFPNGTHLPIQSRKIYERDIWNLAGIGFDDAKLVIERRNDDWVDFSVAHSEWSGTPLKSAILNVFVGDDHQSPLATFMFSNTVDIRASISENRTVGLKAGSKIKAELVIDGNRTNLSPNFQP